ncbi:hypothetical protein E2C01_012899 [Portunus trituberculatus]|uniref:Uncharacterized protein n=1 Tax=Portunus trituberculatus TaxID=210409 RepID=A0A5B7DEW8_PORTR|nr:hypothetical protein [Portunus trituberculatus]
MEEGLVLDIDRVFLPVHLNLPAHSSPTIWLPSQATHTPTLTPTHAHTLTLLPGGDLAYLVGDVSCYGGKLLLELCH